MAIIQTQNLRKEFGSLIAVNDITLSIEKGQVLGLVGPNGAGKTTLLRMIATLLTPTSGAAEVCGFNLQKEYLDIRKKIGFLPDFFNLYQDLTITECLDFFAKAYAVPPELITSNINMALNRVDLQSKRDAFISHLSRGMLQRVGMATLLVRSSEIYILDEPASGLDPRARIKMRETLKSVAKEGKTIIISSHILTELEGFCSHLAIMDKGKIVLSGNIEDIQKERLDVRKIKITVLREPERAVEVLKEMDHLRIMDLQGNVLIIQTSKSLEEIAVLHGQLVQNGVKVVNFNEEKANIEDVFMRISAPGCSN